MLLGGDTTAAVARAHRQFVERSGQQFRGLGAGEVDKMKLVEEAMKQTQGMACLIGIGSGCRKEISVAIGVEEKPWKFPVLPLAMVLGTVLMLGGLYVAFK